MMGDDTMIFNNEDNHGIENNVILIENNLGIKCCLKKVAQYGYALGAISINDEEIETPLTQGIFHLRNIKTHNKQWLYASKIEELSNTKVALSGKGVIEDVEISFTVTFETTYDIKSLRLTYDISLNKDLNDYEICLQYHAHSTHQWKAHLYPWVADSKWVERDRLDNMGIPSVFLYREDRTVGVLWGIDPNSDYLNPTTWTRDFGLYFIDNVLPPQFRVGGGVLRKTIHYHCPMQIVITDKGNPDNMIKDLIKNWINLNRYEVTPLHVRSHDEALRLFIEGRQESKEAWIPGKGYSLHGAHHTFIYFGVQGMAAYFDYLLYEMTGDPMWRKRAFEQMDFIVQGQNRDRNDFNYGAIHTTYQLEWMDDYGPSGPGFNSDDRFNIGYKPDVCALLVRYMLLMWKRVKDHEGIGCQDWYDTALLASNWIIRQQNNDGGLPQKVQMKPLEMRWMDDNNNLVIQPFKSRSSTSGRALPSLWQISAITGESKYQRFLDSLEEFTLRCVQNQYYFNGQHPDLPPYELEEASIWGVAEHWLNRYDDTGDETYLHHAEANAYLAIFWWCPKDLSWVKNPTQGASAEQQHFQQYSVYNYQVRKVEGLWRLYQRTHNPLFLELFERTLQNIYFTQETEGGNKGGTYERIADPWMVREETPGGPHVDSMGSNYTNEQALDCFLQTLELFRMGKNLYMDQNLEHKIYPDGECFYSQDISKLKKAPFKVIPSTGRILLRFGSWKKNAKTWSVTSLNEEPITLQYEVEGLEPISWYKLIVDGKEIDSYQSNSSGKLAFSYSGTVKKGIVFSLENMG